MTSTPPNPEKSTNDTPWKFFGNTIRLRFTEPRFCHWVFEGSPLAEDVGPAVKELQAFARSHPQSLVLCDLQRLKEMSPEIRKVSRENSMGIRVAAIAFIGASFHMRVVMTLLVKAVRLIKREAPMPVAFVNSEQEGWKWLQEQVVPAKEPTSPKTYPKVPD